MRNGAFLFAAAGVLLVSTWLLYFLALHCPVVPWLVFVGWGVLAVGLALVFLPMAVLRGRGQPERNEDFTHTTTLVDGGIYAIVRHPLYLGWSLMYVAVVLFSQHGVIVVLAVLGSACMVLIARQEDRDLIEKFGEAYERYMASVPAMNLVAGTVRRLRRGRGDGHARRRHRLR